MRFSRRSALILGDIVLLDDGAHLPGPCTISARRALRV